MLTLNNGLGETLRVEGVVVELLHGLRLPQTEGANIVGAVTGDRHVVRNSPHVHVVKLDVACLFFAADNEGVAPPPSTGPDAQPGNHPRTAV